MSIQQFVCCTFTLHCSGRRSSEKLGRWTQAEGNGSGKGAYHPWKICENTGANLCNLVHFWRPVQQKMYNSVFNLDFGKQFDDTESGIENWRLSVPLSKAAWNLPSLPYTVGSVAPDSSTSKYNFHLFFNWPNFLGLLQSRWVHKSIHLSTTSYRLDALQVMQPTAWKNWRNINQI